MPKSQKPNTLQRRIQTFLRLLRGYWRFLGWYVVDSIWRFKGKAGAVVASSFLGATLRAMAIGQAIYYAKILAKGKPIKLAGHTFDPTESLLLLCMFAGGVLFTWLLSAALIYYARSRAIRLSVLYEVLCAKRLFYTVAQSRKVWAPEGEKISGDDTVSKVVGSDCRFSGRVLRIALYAIIPAVQFVYFFAIMLYLDVLATLIVAAFVGFSGLFFYMINRLGVRTSRLFEEHTAGAQKEKRRITQYVRDIAFTHEHRSWIDEPFDSGDVSRGLEAYQNRLLVMEYAQLVSDVLTATLICIILLYLGGTALIRAANWGDLIAYLIVFRQSMSNLKAIMRTITSINRFYPQLRRYRDFITNTGVPLGPRISRPRDWELRVAPPCLPESLDNWTLKAGHRLGLVTPAPVTRYTLAFLMDSLLLPSGEELEKVLGATWFAAARYGPPPVGLRAFLQLPADATPNDLCEALGPAGLTSELAGQLANDLDRPLSPEAWEQVDMGVRFALALEAARRSPCGWVLVDEAGLRPLPESARQYLLDRLRDRMVLLVFTGSLDTVGQYGEDLFAVLGDRKVIGLGSAEWVKEQEAAIGRALAPLAETLGVSVEVSEEDEDLLYE